MQVSLHRRPGKESLVTSLDFTFAQASRQSIGKTIAGEFIGAFSVQAAHSVNDPVDGLALKMEESALDFTFFEPLAGYRDHCFQGRSVLRDNFLTSGGNKRGEKNGNKDPSRKLIFGFHPDSFRFFHGLFGFEKDQRVSLRPVLAAASIRCNFSQRMARLSACCHLNSSRSCAKWRRPAARSRIFCFRINPSLEV